MRYQPYPKYKDSGLEWIGEIPEGWSGPRLRYLVAIRNGADYRDFETDDSGFPVFGSGGQFTYTDRFVHEGPSVLLGRKGTIDRPLYIDRPFWTVDTMFFCEIVGHLEAKFLYYYCTTIPFDLYSTVTAVPSMTQSDYGSMILPCPSLHVQAKIATFLDRETAKIDTLVREYEDLIALLTEKRQAFISHAVTRGLSELVDAADPEFGEWCKPVRFRDSGVEWLGEIPERWLASRVKVACAFLTSGPRGWSEQVSDSGILFAQSGDLDGNLGLDIHEMKRVQVIIDAEATRSQLRNGDVVVCITGAKTGNVSVCHGLEEPAFINQHLCLLRPRHSVHPTFLGLALSSDLGRNQFTASQYGLKQGLGLADVANTWIALPDSAYQSAIVAFLTRETTKMDALVRETQDAIELLKEHRSALITAAVTGKINVEGLE